MTMHMASVVRPERGNLYGWIAYEHAATWRDEAACKGQTSLFFIEARCENQHLQIRACREICNACPVLDDCREWALSSHEDYGFIAGMTVRQRREARRHRRAA